jgi:hypothetical protein
MAHQTYNQVSIAALPAIMFSSQIPDVVIGSVSQSAEVTVRLQGEDPVYQETLYPAPGQNYIVMEELQALLTPYAMQRLTVVAEISVGGTVQATFRVIFATVDLGDDVTAQEFYESHFLTLLSGAKQTAIGRLEYLHYYGTDTATVTARYTDGTTKSFEPVVTGGNNNYKQIDVSPGLFTQEGKQLCRYTVVVGGRQQLFDVLPSRPDCAPVLLFVNSFGVEELLYCTGEHQATPEFKRSQTRIGRLLRTYRLEETRHFKADTGPLTQAMADWVDDALRSDEVRVCNFYNGQIRPGKEVTVTEAKHDRSNAPDHMDRATFTYEYAQRNHNVMQLFREGRIFDNTFDDTFN